MARTPAPAIGLRRRTRKDGTVFMAGTVDDEIVLHPGDEIHLRRLHNGGEAAKLTPEFAVIVYRAKHAPSRKDRERAAADRMDGGALRNDPRHDGVMMP